MTSAATYANDTRDPSDWDLSAAASRGLGRGDFSKFHAGQAESRRSRGRAQARGALSIYWFQTSSLLGLARCTASRRTCRVATASRKTI